MKKLSIDPFDIKPSLVKESANVLASGGIVALPTETVYGLAGRIDKDEVVQKLYDIKHRPKDKPFTVAVDSADKALYNIFITLPPFGYRLAEGFWPGPLTLVYESKDGSKVGVRVPGHAVTREVLRQLGVPVFLPSANLSGEQESLSAQEVEFAFGNNIDMIVDGGTCAYGRPSTVVDLTYAPFKILREGVVSETDIVRAFIRKRVVFVCAGNTCRSPLAQYLLTKYMQELKPHKAERYEVISRGILPIEGGGISPEMAQILEEKENTLSADFVSRKIDRFTALSADLIFTMDDVQRQRILELEPSVQGRVFALKKFLPPDLEQDIPDPMGKGFDAYMESYNLIKKAVNELIHWL